MSTKKLFRASSSSHPQPKSQVRDYFNLPFPGYTRMKCTLDPDDHGLHSFRSGAVTHAANLPGITDRQWGKHGGWVDGSAAQTGYVLDFADNALAVPKALAL